MKHRQSKAVPGTQDAIYIVDCFEPASVCFQKACT